MELIKLYFRNKKITIGIPFIISIITALISLLLPNWYKGTATIMPSIGGSSFGDLASLTGMNFGDIFGSSGEHSRIMTILESRSLKEQIVKKYDLIKKYDEENMEFAVEKLSGNISTVIGEQMQISINVYDKDQEKVADMTNFCIQCLDSINNSLYNKSGKNLRRFIEDRFATIKDSIEINQNRLQKLLETNDVISLEEQARLAIMQLSEIKSNMILKEMELDLIKSGTISESQYETIKAELLGLNKAYNTLLNNENTDDQLSINLREIPKIGIDIESLKAKLLYYEKIIEFLGPQYEKAKIDESKNFPTITILDYAVRPEKKAKPSRSKLVIGFFLFSSIISCYGVYFKAINKNDN